VKLTLFFQKVFATPALVALMEEAAVNALSGIEAENCSVGTSINVQHLQATPVGCTVKATAKVVNVVNGRKIVFSITASDEKEVVGKADHERFILNTEKFMAKASAKAPK